MEVVLAEKAGFCFGVNRAVDMAYGLLDEGKKFSMFGPIIHNPQVINDMKARGANIVNSLSEAEKDRILLIRAHGIEKETQQEIINSGIECIDATCPFVRKIHKIVSENSGEKIITMIAGDSSHPEVKGIRSYSKGQSIVFKTSDELSNILNNNSELAKKELIFVAQTIFSIRLAKM